MEIQFFFTRRFSTNTDAVTAYVLQNSQCNDFLLEWHVLVFSMSFFGNLCVLAQDQELRMF